MRDQDSVAVRHIAELRDMLAFSANESQKPHLEWAIERLQSQQDGAQGGDAGWFLPAARINDIQRQSVTEQIARCKQAHHTDLDIRINGQNESHQADWIKHMRPAIAPQATPAAGLLEREQESRRKAIMRYTEAESALQFIRAEVAPVLAEMNNSRATMPDSVIWEWSERITAAIAAPPAEVKP